MSYSFGHCTVPSYVLEESAPSSLPEAQVTFACQSATGQQGGTGLGTVWAPHTAPGAPPIDPRLVLTSKTGAVTTASCWGPFHLGLRRHPPVGRPAHSHGDQRD